MSEGGKARALRPANREAFPDHNGPWCPFCGSRTLRVSRWTKHGSEPTEIDVCYRPGEIGSCPGEYGWRWIRGRAVPGAPAILGGPHDNPAVTDV